MIIVTPFGFNRRKGEACIWDVAIGLKVKEGVYSDLMRDDKRPDNLADGGQLDRGNSFR